MDAFAELVKLATAIVLLVTAIVKLVSTANGSYDRKGKEEGR